MILLRRTAITLLLSVVYISATHYENPIINKEGQAGLVATSSAKTLGKTRLSFSSYADFAYDKNMVQSVIYRKHDDTLTDTLQPVTALIEMHPNVSYGITDFLDIAVSLPLYFDILSNFNPQGGIGDLVFSTKGRLSNSNYRKFNTALSASLSIPIGNTTAGYFPRHSYYYDKTLKTDSVVSFYSSRNFDFDVEALFTLDLDWFLFYLNSGCIFTLNSQTDNALVIKGAIEFRPTSRFALFTEFSSETRFKNVQNGFRIGNDPIWITPGISFTSEAGSLLTLSGGIRLSSGKNEQYYDPKDLKLITKKIQPAFRFGLSLGWSGAMKIQDADKDYVLDKNDTCPKSAEDLDGFEDSDGCPEIDNDKDGIIDTLDKCPNEAEDSDGFADDDGCPEYDNDNDALVDSLDKCKDISEDIDGFADDDGCPEYDNDNDSVPDTLDKCIMVPEDRDNFQDDDGCPDVDNDLDGVPDSLDKCPDTAGVKEEMGCGSPKTKAKEIKQGKIILPGVGFEPKTSVLVQSAYVILDQVFQSLSAYNAVILEIRGHTDNSGNTAHNLTLTQKRAEAVRDYLVGRGISKERLIAVGKGDAEPIADNSSIPGRQLNNRIEIFRLDK